MEGFNFQIDTILAILFSLFSLFSFLVSSLVSSKINEDDTVIDDPGKPTKPDYSRARVVDLKSVLKKRRREKKGRSKAAFLKPRSKHPFVMRVPLAWFRILEDAKATAAWPLLLAICNQMIIKRKSSVSITARVWETAARSTTRRKAMLRALERVPDLVRLEKRKRLSSWYRAHQGPLWTAEFSYDRLDAIEDDDED